CGPPCHHRGHGGGEAEAKGGTGNAAWWWYGRHGLLVTPKARKTASSGAVFFFSRTCDAEHPDHRCQSRNWTRVRQTVFGRWLAGLRGLSRSRFCFPAAPVG